MLVRSEPRGGSSLDALRGDIARLEALFTDRAAEHAALKAEREAFRTRYQAEVGRLHERLDELELAIAEAELGELSRRLDEAASSAQASAALPVPAPLPRFTSDAVRTLFRDVAKLVHPDLAADERGRDARHALMVEANRAYMLGDETHLRWILETLRTPGDMADACSADEMRTRLLRRSEHLETQLRRLEDEIAALKASPLWQLKVMVDQAAVRGRDLVREMVRRLERDIMVATNRLDAMRSTGDGL